jgi:hypothetical protein
MTHAAVNTFPGRGVPLVGGAFIVHATDRGTPARYDLAQVLEHEGPLPHPVRDRPQ